MGPKPQQLGEWDWVTGNNPRTMLSFLRGKLSERKRRLFACACCRMVWAILHDERSREAVTCAERYADGLAILAELDGAADSANTAWLDEITGPVFQRAGCAAFQCAVAGQDELWQLDLTWADAALALEGQEIARTWIGTPDELTQALESWCEAWGGSGEPMGWTDANPEAEMAALLRCIVGNPFRPVAIDHAWLTPTVVALAEGIYAERAFDRLPILADALQDAGCGNEDVLAHCRGAGPHARGCWVIDLLLGKT